MTEPADKQLRLDDLYRMTAHIYSDRNSVRSKEATFAHFVEVCGALTVYDRKKKREKIDYVDALCKALGWYFPLLAKLKVESVERLVFRKFPGVCPYCRQSPHQEAICKQVKGTSNTVNHSEVTEIFDKNWQERPYSLDDWQNMFSRIYPRTINENGRSSLGILEEIGELAEAIRVFDVHPHYFLGEAADTFSYIMGLANEHSIREAQEDKSFSFEKEYISRYPGLCTQCGSKICSCPSIPEATIGRMAKELNIRSAENLFITNPEEFAELGKIASHRALENMGGYSGLVQRLPFDRGDTNHALIQLCLRIAASIEQSNPALAQTLQAEAIRLGDITKEAGTARDPLPIADLIDQIRKIWGDLDKDRREEIKSVGGFIEEIGDIFDTVRVLFITCDPSTERNSLKLRTEMRSVREALKRAGNSSKIFIKELPAATPNDLRQELLHDKYDIVHFSGHSDQNGLLFQNESGGEQYVPIEAIATLFKNYPNIRCLILNSCESVKNMTKPIAQLTIGMDEEIDDGAAIAFSAGFYDALAAGKSFRRALSEGVSAVALANYDHTLIKAIPDGIV